MSALPHPYEMGGDYRYRVNYIVDPELREFIRSKMTRGEMLNVRLRVALRDDGICGICRLDVKLAEFSVDHIIPRSHGGTNSAENLRTAHMACNQKRGVAGCPHCEPSRCGRCHELTDLHYKVKGASPKSIHAILLYVCPTAIFLDPRDAK